MFTLDHQDFWVWRHDTAPGLFTVIARTHDGWRIFVSVAQQEATGSRIGAFDRPRFDTVEEAAAYCLLEGLVTSGG